MMLVASILLVGSLIRNPAFPHPGAAKLAAAPARGVYAITRHPMNWSFILWALTHIAVHGSPRNLIVAVGILVLAVAGSIGQDAKKRALMKDWSKWEARTRSRRSGRCSAAGEVARRVPGPVALGGGCVVWLAVTSLHAPSASLPGWLGLL
jgi:uncharacterized membrane protein